MWEISQLTMQHRGGEVMDQLYCTVCPNQCLMEVSTQEKEIMVKGNRCARGLDFAKQETVCPVRVLTSTVLGAETGGWVLVPVRSRNAIPLKQHMEIMDVLKKVRIDHSVEMGDVVLPNAKGSGEDIIACAPSRVCSFLYSISN